MRVKKRFTRDEMHQTINVCHDCHRAIHNLIPDEKELGRDYNTAERILAHEHVARYMTWIRKQK